MADKYISFSRGDEYLYWLDKPVLTGGDEIIVTLLWKQYSTSYPKNYLFQFDNTAYDIYVTNSVDSPRFAPIVADNWSSTLFGLEEGRSNTVKFTLPFQDSNSITMNLFGTRSGNFDNFQGALYRIQINAASGNRDYLCTTDLMGRPNILDVLGTPLDGFRFTPSRPVRFDIKPIEMKVGDTVEWELTPMSPSTSGYFFDSSDDRRPYCLTDTNNTWFFNVEYLRLFVDGVEVGDRAATIDYTKGKQQIRAEIIKDCSIDVLGQRYSNDNTGIGVYYNIRFNSTAEASRTYMFDKALGSPYVLPDSLGDTTDYGDLSLATSAGDFVWDGSSSWNKTNATVGAILKLFPVTLGDTGIVDLVTTLVNAELVHIDSLEAVTIIDHGTSSTLVAPYTAPSDGHIGVRIVDDGVGSVTAISRFIGDSHAKAFGDTSAGYLDYTITDAYHSPNSSTNFVETNTRVHKASSYAIVEEGYDDKVSVADFKAVALISKYKPAVCIMKSSSYAIVEEGYDDKVSVADFKAVALISKPVYEVLSRLDTNVESGLIDDYRQRLGGKNLLTNGDFSSGDLTGWELVSGSDIYVNTKADAQLTSAKGRGQFFMYQAGSYPSNIHLRQSGEFDSMVLSKLGKYGVTATMSFFVSSHTATSSYTSVDYGQCILDILDAEGAVIQQVVGNTKRANYRSQEWLLEKSEPVDIPVGAASWVFSYKTVRPNRWALLCSSDIGLNVSISDTPI